MIRERNDPGTYQHSQEQMANRIALPQMRISRIETGKIVPWRFDTLLDSIPGLNRDSTTPHRQNTRSRRSGVAMCQHGHPVRFATAAALVSELIGSGTKEAAPIAEIDGSRTITTIARCYTHCKLQPVQTASFGNQSEVCSSQGSRVLTPAGRASSEGCQTYSLSTA